jgi:hypothetical protein
MLDFQTLTVDDEEIYFSYPDYLDFFIFTDISQIIITFFKICTYKSNNLTKFSYASQNFVQIQTCHSFNYGGYNL